MATAKQAVVKHPGYDLGLSEEEARWLHTALGFLMPRDLELLSGGLAIECKGNLINILEALRSAGVRGYNE